MGIVRTDITLKNVKDIIKAEEGLINESEIRQTTVEAMVDPVRQVLTGAHGDEIVTMMKKAVRTR